MKNFPQPKQSRKHAKRKIYFKKYRATRSPSKQNLKQGGTNDYHTT